MTNTTQTKTTTTQTISKFDLIEEINQSLGIENLVDYKEMTKSLMNVSNIKLKSIRSKLRTFKKSCQKLTKVFSEFEDNEVRSFFDLHSFNQLNKEKLRNIVKESI